MTKSNIKNLIKDIHNQLESINNSLIDIEFAGYIPSKKRSIDIYPDMITPNMNRSLKKLGINTLLDLSRLTEDQLLKTSGIGIEAIRKMKMLLECHGLKLSL